MPGSNPGEGDLTIFGGYQRFLWSFSNIYFLHKSNSPVQLEGGTCLRPMRLISRQEEATNRLRRMLTRQLEEAVQQGEVKSIIVY